MCLTARSDVVVDIGDPCIPISVMLKRSPNPHPFFMIQIYHDRGANSLKSKQKKTSRVDRQGTRGKALTKMR